MYVACDCDGIGSLGRSCDVTTGQCRCRPNYGGRNCGQCAAGYYNYPACQRKNHSLSLRMMEGIEVTYSPDVTKAIAV